MSRTTRFIHLTDTHVRPDDASGPGTLAAFAAALEFHPDFLITGGDHVACVLTAAAEDAHAQFREYRDVLSAASPPCPVYPVLGNHDVFAWGKPDVAPSTRGYGKALAMHYLGMKRTHYTIDAGPWRILCLDNIAHRAGGYYGDLDAAQLEWLQHELAFAGHKHVAVVTHIPLLSAAVFFDGTERVREDHYHVPDAWMHRNAEPLLRILRQGNARLMISGHIHLLDRVEYNGMTFICDGSVSGNWWHGAYHETPPGVGLFDLHDDGTFEHDYVPLDVPADAELLAPDARDDGPT